MCFIVLFFHYILYMYIIMSTSIYTVKSITEVKLLTLLINDLKFIDDACIGIALAR